MSEYQVKVSTKISIPDDLTERVKRYGTGNLDACVAVEQEQAMEIVMFAAESGEFDVSVEPVSPTVGSSIESEALSAVIEDRTADVRAELEKLDRDTLAVFARQLAGLLDMAWRVHDEKRAAEKEAGRA